MQGITQSSEGLGLIQTWRENERTKQTKLFFSPSLVSSLRYQLFLPLKTSILQGNFKGKTFFKPLCLNVNKICDVDVAIDWAGYQSKKLQGKTTLHVFFVFSTWPVPPSGIYGTLLLLVVLLTWDNSEKKNTIRVELRALPISGPPSCVCKGRLCKVGNLIARRKNSRN